MEYNLNFLQGTSMRGRLFPGDSGTGEICLVFEGTFHFLLLGAGEPGGGRSSHLEKCRKEAEPNPPLLKIKISATELLST